MSLSTSIPSIFQEKIITASPTMHMEVWHIIPIVSRRHGSSALGSFGRHL
jgi:hypothetical protein